VRGYVVDVYFCVFDVSVEEFGVFVATKKFVTNPKNQQHLVTLQNADATPKQKQLAYTALVNQLAVEMQMPITMCQCRYCQIGTSASLWWFCRLCWRILLCCLCSFCY
jgi:hypothetical protein